MAVNNFSGRGRKNPNKGILDYIQGDSVKVCQKIVVIDRELTARGPLEDLGEDDIALRTTLRGKVVISKCECSAISSSSRSSSSRGTTTTKSTRSLKVTANKSRDKIALLAYQPFTLHTILSTPCFRARNYLP